MGDPYVKASHEYLQRRHEIALRLLAACDKQASAPDVVQENAARDRALLALVKRDYSQAAEITQQLAEQQEREKHVQQRRQQLRQECDRLCSARATLEQRQELLDSAPTAIEDPYIGGVGAYLERRHTTALRLLAALDTELARCGSASPEDARQAQLLKVKREHLSIESDTLLKALQVFEDREELLETAGDTLGDGTPDTSADLRRVLAYLDARSTIILKLVASIDQRLGSKVLSPEDESHLTHQRKELTAELDQVHEKIKEQKRGEEELRACGLKSAEGDPYHIKVTRYLQNRSDVALQLIAFLDRRLDGLNSQAETPESLQEREALAQRRELLQREADEALAQMEQQAQGQALLDSLDVATKTARDMPAAA